MEKNCSSNKNVVSLSVIAQEQHCNTNWIAHGPAASKLRSNLRQPIFHRSLLFCISTCNAYNREQLISAKTREIPHCSNRWNIYENHQALRRQAKLWPTNLAFEMPSARGTQLSATRCRSRKGPYSLPSPSPPGTRLLLPGIKRAPKYLVKSLPSELPREKCVCTRRRRQA